MKGLFFRETGSLDHLRVEELPLPVPKAGEVLVKVLAAAVNPSDTKNVLGKMAEVRPPKCPGGTLPAAFVQGTRTGRASRSSALAGISVLEGMAATRNLWLFP